MGAEKGIAYIYAPMERKFTLSHLGAHPWHTPRMGRKRWPKVSPVINKIEITPVGADIRIYRMSLFYSSVKAGKSLTSSRPASKVSRWSRAEAPGKIG